MNVCVYMCVYMYIYLCIYIYIYPDPDPRYPEARRPDPEGSSPMIFYISLIATFIASSRLLALTYTTVSGPLPEFQTAQTLLGVPQ